MMAKRSINKEEKVALILKIVAIIILVAVNIYLYVNKALPGAIASSIDLRYARATDFVHHTWAGIEEYPSMLICILPLALFPTIEAARIGWFIANIVFLIIVMVGLRKSFFRNCDIMTFSIWMLLLSSSAPVVIAFINAQNLLFSFAFFITAYNLSEQIRSGGKSYGSKTMLALSWAVGILLGISYFKYSIIFFLAPIFIYRKRYIEIASSIIFHIVLTIFSMWWLDVSLLKIMISPITSSVKTNTGVGFIDLMTILNGGSIFAPDFFKGHHGHEAYYIVFVVLLILVLVMAFQPLLQLNSKGNEKLEEKTFLLFSMYCALSVIIIYHRQYDYWILIIPIYYCVQRLIGKNTTTSLLEKIILLISIIGTAFIMHGNWIMKLLGITIEYGDGQKLFYYASACGLYLMNMYFVGKNVWLKASVVASSELI